MKTEDGAAWVRQDGSTVWHFRVDRAGEWAPGSLACGAGPTRLLVVAPLQWQTVPPPAQWCRRCLTAAAINERSGGYPRRRGPASGKPSA